MGTKKNENHKVVRRRVYEEGARAQGPFEALHSGSTMGNRTKGAWPPTDILNTFLFGHQLAARAPAGNVGAHHCTRPGISLSPPAFVLWTSCPCLSSTARTVLTYAGSRPSNLQISARTSLHPRTSLSRTRSPPCLACVPVAPI